MYRVRTTTVPLEPDQCPSMSPQGRPAPITGIRDRRQAHRKRRPTNATANGSSKSRVVAERADSLALQTATAVAVRLTASCIVAFDPPPADPWPQIIRPIRVHGLLGVPPCGAWATLPWADLAGYAVPPAPHAAHRGREAMARRRTVYRENH